MLERSSSARIVMTTVVSPEEGTRLGRTLVEEHLAGLRPTLLPPVHSIYRWHDKIESSAETLLLLKTATHQLPVSVSRLQELHSYQTPEFLVLAIEAGSSTYLSWLGACLGASQRTAVLSQVALVQATLSRFGNTLPCQKGTQGHRSYGSRLGCPKRSYAISETAVGAVEDLWYAWGGPTHALAPDRLSRVARSAAFCGQASLVIFGGTAQRPEMSCRLHSSGPKSLTWN